MNTEIICILDRSGSMANIKKDTIGGFNSFLAEQKTVPGEAKVTLIQFDGQYEKCYQGLPLSEVQDLTDATFVPRGSTALLDAIGKTLIEQKTRIQKEAWANKVIIVILTDGEENSSVEFNRDTIKTLTESAQNDEWSFIYLGANQDSFSVASTMGINVKSALNSVANYACNAEGLEFATRSYSGATTNLRMGKSANADLNININVNK